MTSLLEVRGLEAGYGEIQVLFGVNLTLKLGETVALLGANGAGKTTLLRALMGLIPARGTLLLEGLPLASLSTEQRVQRGVALVPEGRKLFAGLSVEENLLSGSFRLPPQERRRALEEVYEVFPLLAQRRKQLAGTLSGGQQQMVAIGRALIARPKLLLVDEFSWGLAPIVVEELAQVLVRLGQGGQMGLLLVEQDLQVGLQLAQRGYVMEHGRIVLEGPSEDLLSSPGIREAYLGL
jgi:branched-chain amino acid transport system ATP-binding protein